MTRSCVEGHQPTIAIAAFRGNAFELLSANSASDRRQGMQTYVRRSPSKQPALNASPPAKTQRRPGASSNDRLQRIVESQALQRSARSDRGGREKGRVPGASTESVGGSVRTGADWSGIGGARSGISIGAPGDRFEQEADRVADGVMRMTANEPTRHGASSRSPAGRHSAASDWFPLSGGRSLNLAERAYFEPRLGFDFGRVRLHQDSNADAAAFGLGARAFTVGSDIYFRAGANTSAQEGRRTLAHELTHVVQQDPSARNGEPGLPSEPGRLTGDPAPTPIVQRTPDAPLLQMDCAEDKRECRNAMNYSDGGHWIGPGRQPDCNCDSTLSDAQAACGNRFNWSDGGHWIGSGPEPDCSLTETAETTHTVTYLFPTNECVQQFNSDRNEIATHVSTGGGIVTGAITSRFSSPWIGIVAGAAVNELIGAIPQTPIGVGYRWVRTFTARYTRSAHPWGVNSLTIGLETEVLDERNQLVHGFSASFEMPEESRVRVGPMLTGQPDSSHTITCPRGNILSM
ncbi:MAG: DUF4157 domain-containing protein [Gemmatimonas sp.]|nr:DUF4157 domain-containing protein [Gemmatimonas sp.]